MTIDNDPPYYRPSQDDTRLPPDSTPATSPEPAPYAHAWSSTQGGNGLGRTDADERPEDPEASVTPPDSGAHATEQPAHAGNGAISLANGSTPSASTHFDELHAEMPGAGAGEGEGEGQDLPLPDDLTGKLPGFTKPASDCINKARRIARELNHTGVSAAHLALALTLDHRSSRRLRDQGVDVDRVREAAIRNLCKFNFVYSSGTAVATTESRASPDLADILDIATRFAQEKDDEEEINISDLLDAFRKSSSGLKLIYEVPEASDQLSVILRRVEQAVGQQISRFFTDMQQQLAPAPRLERLVEEIELRLETLPRIDAALADIETAALSRTEDRLTVLLNNASTQLAQELRTFREQNQQLAQQADRLTRTERPAGPSWWPGGSR